MEPADTLTSVDVVDDFKTEIENLEPADKRWIFTCLLVAVAALLYALLVGNIAGNILGFVLAVAAGWVLRWQWEAVTRPTRNARSRRVSTTSSTPDDKDMSTGSMAARWRRRTLVSLGLADEREPDETRTPQDPNRAVADMPHEPRP